MENADINSAVGRFECRAKKAAKLDKDRVKEDGPIGERLLAVVKKRPITKNDLYYFEHAIYVDGENLTEEAKKKREVLSRLPDDFREQVWKAMLVDLEEGQLEEEIDTESEEIKGRLRARARGRMFELLVEAEFAPQQLQIERKITEALQGAWKSNLHLFNGIGKNEDLTFVRVRNDGTIAVSQFGEAKLAPLDQRAADQFANSGIRRSIFGLVRLINDGRVKFPDGLEILNMAKGKINVAPDLEQILIVPADRPLELERLIDTDSFDNDLKWSEKRERLERMLKNGQITVKKSLFTWREVDDMVEYGLSAWGNFVDREKEKMRTLKER
jgi:hypothetical protein